MGCLLPGFRFTFCTNSSVVLALGPLPSSIVVGCCGLGAGCKFWVPLGHSCISEARGVLTNGSGLPGNGPRFPETGLICLSGWFGVLDWGFCPDLPRFWAGTRVPGAGHGPLFGGLSARPLFPQAPWGGNSGRRQSGGRRSRRGFVPAAVHGLPAGVLAQGSRG